MTALCPACGAEVAPSRLLVDLNNNTATRLGVTVKLTPRHAEILSILQSAYPRRVHRDRVLARVYGAAKNSAQAREALVSNIVHLRLRLAQIGVAIPDARAGGYCLTVHDAPITYIRRAVPVRWSAADVETLKALWFTSRVSAIAEQLKRSNWSVRVKARTLGLPARQILNPPRKAA